MIAVTGALEFIAASRAESLLNRWLSGPTGPVLKLWGDPYGANIDTARIRNSTKRGPLLLVIAVNLNDVELKIRRIFLAASVVPLSVFNGQAH